MANEVSFYSTLTTEEESRMPPCTKARCVIMSTDTSSPLQTSIPLAGYDIPDEARSGKVTPIASTIPLTNKLLNNADHDTERIVDNVVPISHTVLPAPEPKPKIERNGLDQETKKPITQLENDSCVVDCIYVAQQCCECVIF